jgi:hypothetical protein
MGGFGLALVNMALNLKILKDVEIWWLDVIGILSKTVLEGANIGVLLVFGCINSISLFWLGLETVKIFLIFWWKQSGTTCSFMWMDHMQGNSHHDIHISFSCLILLVQAMKITMNIFNVKCISITVGILIKKFPCFHFCWHHCNVYNVHITTVYILKQTSKNSIIWKSSVMCISSHGVQKKSRRNQWFLIPNICPQTHNPLLCGLRNIKICSSTDVTFL